MYTSNPISKTQYRTCSFEHLEDLEVVPHPQNVIHINNDMNINIHTDINMNIDIHIIIDMNIEYYIIYYLLPISYSLLLTKFDQILTNINQYWQILTNYWQKMTKTVKHMSFSKGACLKTNKKRLRQVWNAAIMGWGYQSI